ncbi:hypothetical protein POJ06DRAFT_259585 [Lipomyces tetrasporus]|uniref:Uncharacterized protein n=1 Tax=Lipomyces tetrasporus TaxID=54092 RepID=A0AAD7QPC6_9ASCO|nr:uncharacterized protein POJ06DRAFT_259585 [Lipomyces tetrasporus]KAJ8098481.1 hypothetical protein POJ06DRAFT_259585 [Lipomyces tetrasporus]
MIILISYPFRVDSKMLSNSTIASSKFCCPPAFDYNCIILVEPPPYNVGLACGNLICCPHFYPNGTVNMAGTICGTPRAGEMLTCQNGVMSGVAATSGSSATATLNRENVSIMTLVTITLLLLQMFQWEM